MKTNYYANASFRAVLNPKDSLTAPQRAGSCPNRRNRTSDSPSVLTPACLSRCCESLQEPPAQIDKAAELQAKWGTETGQLWQVGPNRLLCADCRGNSRRGAAMVDGERFRMVWTDPPYSVDYAEKTGDLTRRTGARAFRKPIESDALKPEQVGELFTAALMVSQAHAIQGATCYASVPAGPMLAVFIDAMCRRDRF
jgi:hypothetical protein